MNDSAIIMYNENTFLTVKVFFWNFDRILIVANSDAVFLVIEGNITETINY